VLLYASDYPHWDSNFDSVNAIRTRARLSESARGKILSGNAQRLFGLLVQAPVIG
jgi:predicted TIM-barrel fold metal-dependent hydrolase